MKIGILTYHYAHNYGAILQAVALSDYLTNIGHDVVFINYKNSNVSRIYKIFPSINFSIKSVLTYVPLSIMRFLRFSSFQHYAKKHIKTISVNELAQLNCIIIGSDQVWNPKLTNGLDKTYWGNIHCQCPIIAYAPSIDKSSINQQEEDEIKHYLNNFSFISVREYTSKILLEKLTNKKIQVVADPTVLNDHLYWKNKCKKINSNRYILAYYLRDKDEVLSIAKKIAKEKHMKLKIFKGSTNWNPISKEMNIAGPQKMLNYINNAHLVITSSFHGTALSILFHKNFYSIKCKDGNNERIHNLLKIVNLENRFIRNDDIWDIEENINYIHVEQHLDEYRNTSFSYLREALSTIKTNK